jgi:hypothetical protein
LQLPQYEPSTSALSTVLVKQETIEAEVRSVPMDAGMFFSANMFYGQQILRIFTLWKRPLNSSAVTVLCRQNLATVLLNDLYLDGHILGLPKVEDIDEDQDIDIQV